MRNLPEPDLPLRDAADFILESRLGRAALSYGKFSMLPLFLRDLITEIHKLTRSCNLPEFTDHGLNHLSSLVDRISLWSGVSSRKSDLLCDILKKADAAVLLIAVLIHDIGMISQKSEDLEESQPELESMRNTDLAYWVRKTHIPRMKKLVKRLFSSKMKFTGLLESDFMERAFKVARAHGTWPWDHDFTIMSENDQGLAAVLSIADLLDEDANRCDTRTLLLHKECTQSNIAHWLRHALTRDRVLILDQTMEVKFGKLFNTDAYFEPVYSALRNQYRLVCFYSDALGLIGAKKILCLFDPPTGCASEIIHNLQDWDKLTNIQTQSTLMPIILSSIFNIALLDKRKVTPDIIQKALNEYEFETVDLASFYYYTTPGVIQSQEELEFRTMIQKS